MEVEGYSFKPEKENKRAKTAVSFAGISWAILFGFILTDEIFGEMLDKGLEGAGFLCLTPLFVLSILGFTIGVILGLTSLKQIKANNENNLEDAQNAIKYGAFGIAFIILTPLINKLTELIGIHLYSYTDLLNF